MFQAQSISQTVGFKTGSVDSPQSKGIFEKTDVWGMCKQASDKSINSIQSPVFTAIRIYWRLSILNDQIIILPFSLFRSKTSCSPIEGNLCDCMLLKHFKHILDQHFPLLQRGWKSGRTVLEPPLVASADSGYRPWIFYVVYPNPEKKKKSLTSTVAVGRSRLQKDFC